MTKTCKSGYILRKGYTRKTGTRVRPACIADLGARGKGPRRIGTLKKGKLAQFGYSARKSARARHAALNAAVKKYGPLSVYRKLNAVAVYTKRTAPSASKVFLQDRAFVGKKVGYKE